MSNNPLQKSGMIRFSDIMKEKEWMGTEAKTLSALVEQNDRLSPYLVLNFYNPAVMTGRISNKPYSISSWYGYNHALGETMTVLDGTITGGNMRSMLKTRYMSGSGTGFYNRHYTNLNGLFTECTSGEADFLNEGNTSLSAYNFYEVTERVTNLAGNYTVAVQRPYLEIDLSAINPNRRIAAAELTLTGLTNTYSPCRMILVQYESASWAVGNFSWRYVISNPVMFTTGDQTFTLNAYGISLINAAIASADKKLRIGFITHDWDCAWDTYIGPNLLSGNNQTFETTGAWTASSGITLETVTTNLNRTLAGRKALHAFKGTYSDNLRFSLPGSAFDFTPANGIDYYTHLWYRFENFDASFGGFYSESALTGALLGNVSGPINPYLIYPQDPSLISTNWFRAGWNNTLNNKTYAGETDLHFSIGGNSHYASVGGVYILDPRIVPILFTKTWGAKYNNPRLKYYYAGLPGSVSTGGVSGISSTGATVAVTISDDGCTNILSSGICWNTTGSPTTSDNKTTNGNTSVSSFNSAMTGLTLGTTYYVRSYVTTEVGTTYGAQTTVTTLGLPTVTTQAATSVSYTSAQFNGTASADGGQSITDRGFVYKAGGEPTMTDNKTSASVPSGTGVFSLIKSGLTSGVTYYVKAYATNASGTQLSTSSVSFSTPSNLPVVTWSAATLYDPQAYYVTLNGLASADGGSSITDRGFVYKAGSNPTITDNKTSATTPTGTGSFSKTISGLTPNTTYYFATYATNANGTSLSGTIGSFTTPIGIPVVNSTTAASNVGQTSATSGGYISTDNTFPVTERGVCWNTSGNPTTSNSKVTSGTGTGTFSVTLTGLALGTTYYARCYAINSAGVGYAEQISFTTLGANLPTVASTTTVSSIAQTTATSGGNVTSEGGATITERGICWATSQNPTTSNSKQTASGTTGSFSANLSGLSASTTYYVRAYATNSQGTAYASQVSFTTAASISLPSVSTTTPGQVTYNSYWVGCYVSADGGATVTERGYVMNTSGFPTTLSYTHKGYNGSGTGYCDIYVSGLSPNTTYYVRGYAINSAGTAYGSQLSFTTGSAPVTPTVSTDSPATNIGPTGATVGGNVSSDGGASVTERGVCYNTSGSPTTSNSVVTSGTGTGSFSVSLSGLSQSTTYYARGYAINSAGTSYGSQISFTTSGAATTPTVVSGWSDPWSSVHRTSPSKNDIGTITNEVTSDGGSTITERGIIHSITYSTPTVDNATKVIVSGTTGTFDAVILNYYRDGQTFYWRAYATNAQGTSYGIVRTLLLDVGFWDM